MAEPTSDGARRIRRVRPVVTRHDDDYALPAPVVTYALLTVLVVVLVAMLRASHSWNEVSQVVAYRFGDKQNDLIRHGQWWRLITPIFLHAGLVHLFVNGLSLVLLGGSLERIYGGRKYLLVLMISGIAGNMASYLHSTAPSLGASGAIFGLVGAGMVFPIRYRSLVSEKSRNAILRQLVPIAAINLYIGFAMSQLMVDNWAHLGGLAGGALAATILMPDALAESAPGRLRNTLLWVATVAMIGLTVVAAGLQARETPPSELMTYTPREQNPWWSITIPGDWKEHSGPHGTFWRSAYGAAALVTTSEQNPALLGVVQELRNRNVGPTTLLGNQPTWKMRLDGGDNSAVVYVAAVGGRVFELRVAYPTSKAKAALADAAVIAGRVQFSRTAAGAPVISPPPQPVLP